MMLVLHHKCLVHYLLESRQGVSYQLILQSFIKTVQKQLLFLLIISHILRSVPQQLNELVTILTYRHTALLKTKKLLLKLDHLSWNMMRPEVILEF
jgi:hypothetical protein